MTVVAGLIVGAASLCGATQARAVVAAPAEWGFEQVTPANKGGGTVNSLDNFQTRADGNVFLHSASGSYEEPAAESSPLYTRYLATRTESGWFNLPLDPPFDPLPPNSAGSVIVTVLGTSHDLRYAVVTSMRALAPGAIEGGGNLYLRDTSSGSYRLLVAHPDPQLVKNFTANDPDIKYVGLDGKSVLFQSSIALVNGAPDGVGGTVLYRWSEAAGVEVVSKLPASAGGAYVRARTAVGYRSPEAGGDRNSLPRSNGEDVIYFSAATESGGAAYRWADGEVSVISKSEVTGDAGRVVGAQVLATTPDGAYALLLTDDYTGRLTNDTPSLAEGTPEQQTVRILYRYELATESLEYVGVADFYTNYPAEQMSPDGQTVVFKTQQQLTPDAHEFVGFDPRDRLNYYVWRKGSLRFVTSFTGGLGAGPASRLLSDNGRFLTFVDGSQENASRFGIADNTSVKCSHDGSGVAGLCDHVYRFDVERPNSLECVSCAPDGSGPGGHSGDPGNTLGRMIMNGRAVQTITDDGTVFFTSSDDLIDSDSNGLRDAYAFRDGALQLASPAVQGASTRFIDATPDGSSVFVATNARLAETDRDRSVDIYQTRRGGGFPAVQAMNEPPCTGSDCRTVTPDAGPNGGKLPEGSSRVGSIGAPPRKMAGRHRIWVTAVVRRRASLQVSVRTTGPGLVRVSGKRIRSASRRAARAGDLNVSVPLSAGVRSAIKRDGRFRVRMRVSLSPSFGAPSAVIATRTVR